MQRYENGRKVLREKKFAGPRNLRQRHGNDAIDDANRNRRSRRQQQKARRMKDGGSGREADRRTRSRTNRCNLQMATRQK